MVGPSNRHNDLRTNLMTGLGSRLRGGPCKPFGSDAKIVSPTGRTRYPDLTV
jgi:hypothetical protein